jgi:hypothetical protein
LTTISPAAGRIPNDQAYAYFSREGYLMIADETKQASINELLDGGSLPATDASEPDTRTSREKFADWRAQAQPFWYVYLVQLILCLTLVATIYIVVRDFDAASDRLGVISGLLLALMGFAPALLSTRPFLVSLLDNRIRKRAAIGLFMGIALMVIGMLIVKDSALPRALEPVTAEEMTGPSYAPVVPQPEYPIGEAEEAPATSAIETTTATSAPAPATSDQKTRTQVPTPAQQAPVTPSPAPSSPSATESSPQADPQPPVQPPAEQPDPAPPSAEEPQVDPDPPAAEQPSGDPPQSDPGEPTDIVTPGNPEVDQPPDDGTTPGDVVDPPAT